jgi:hypothetical protein
MCLFLLIIMEAHPLDTVDVSLIWKHDLGKLNNFVNK